MLIAFATTAITAFTNNKGIHDLSGKIFIVLVIIHIILHWNWIYCITKNLFKSKQQTISN